MSCKDFERQIALGAGGDLTSPEAEGLRAHIESCAACRELEREIVDVHVVLADAAVEPDEFALARIRREVLAHVAAPRQGFRIWRWAAALAMAAAALWFVVLASRPAPPPVIAVRHSVPRPPEIAPPAPEPAPPQVAAVHARRRARIRPAPAKPQEELVIRLATSDPDVVIYWIVEGKGD